MSELLESDLARSPMYRAQRLRNKARSKVHREVKAGRLPTVSTLSCHDCDCKAAEYDHHKGYEEENWLNVQAVCKQCHIVRTTDFLKAGGLDPIRFSEEQIIFNRRLDEERHSKILKEDPECGKWKTRHLLKDIAKKRKRRVRVLKELSTLDEKIESLQRCLGDQTSFWFYDIRSSK